MKSKNQNWPVNYIEFSNDQLYTSADKTKRIAIFNK